MAKKSIKTAKKTKMAPKKPVSKAKPQLKQKTKPKAKLKSKPKVAESPKDKLVSRELDDLVVNLAGEDVLPLVVLLKGKENVSEFLIADRLNVTVNQVRNMLYRLHKANLVTFTRKKDKKKGWYIYYWTLAVGRLEDALHQQKKRQHTEFVEKLSKEEFGKFYVCPTKCVRMTMEDAMEADFHCPECGQLLVEQDNKRTIENIKRRIEELTAEIKVEEDKRAVELERLREAIKRAAKRAVSKKKSVKKKAASERRALKKAATKVVVKKVVKKAVKKAPVKKTVKKVVKKVIKKAVAKKAVKKVVKNPAKKGFLKKLFGRK